MRSHPKAVVEHRDLVLKCLSDADETIRLRALELLTGMVTKRNLEELIHKLLRYVAVAEGSYRDELISKIVYMCSRDKFAYLSDFGWYLMVLVEMAMVPGTSHGSLVSRQLMDVSVRVAPVRPFAVESMIGLLLDKKLVNGPGRSTIIEVLFASAWVVGEFAALIPSVSAAALKRGADAGVDVAAIADTSKNLENTEADLVNVRGPNAGGSRASLRFPRKYPFLVILRALLDPKITNLPASVQNVYMQNALKVVIAAAQPGVCDDTELSSIVVVCSKRLPIFRRSTLVEVQERAHFTATTLKSLGMIVESLAEVVPKKEVKKADDTEADIGSSMPDMPGDTMGSGGMMMG
jgi:AP-3 complex subunit delta